MVASFEMPRSDEVQTMRLADSNAYDDIRRPTAGRQTQLPVHRLLRRVVIVQAMEVPPTASIGHEIEDPIWRPRWLKDGSAIPPATLLVSRNVLSS